MDDKDYNLLRDLDQTLRRTERRAFWIGFLVGILGVSGAFAVCKIMLSFF